MKLVINSNLRYAVPLGVLFESLVRANWRRWRDVVVVRGGAEKDCVMQRKLREITSIELGRASDETVVVCDVELENYDYHGFVALQKYQADPLVADSWYFYVLDTVTFSDAFVDIFDTFVVARRHLLKYDDKGDELSTVFSCKLPNSNICIFNAQVVERYGTVYEKHTFTKKEAMQLECGHHVHGIKPLPTYAKIKVPLQQREFKGYADCYSTGFSRDVWYYPDIGVIKYILWGMSGDIGEADAGAFSY